MKKKVLTVLLAVIYLCIGYAMGSLMIDEKFFVQLVLGTLFETLFLIAFCLIVLVLATKPLEIIENIISEFIKKEKKIRSLEADNAFLEVELQEAYERENKENKGE